jgi:cysteinyl-tRNA synthetase
MKLYSTLDRKVVDIKTIKDGLVSIYSCGPTVYYRMHVGNLRAYVNWDVFHRALLYLGYDVKRIMNMTDVGHMTSDEDFGEDKLQKQASKEGIDPLEIANKYIKTVLEDFSSLNILSPNGEVIDPNWDVNSVKEHGWTRATDYIEEMIQIIKSIESNGYTYETDQAVYFDVTKIPDYTIFTGQKLDEKEIGVREEVGVDPEKRNPADFVLWMKRVGKYENHIMHWSSPWGEGFPGWHIECSAMGTAILGEYFDIHTGGIDHIPVHHTNERAQNIGAFGHPVVKYWVHNEWLVSSDDTKLSKSSGNASNLSEIISLGFDPLDVRYLFMSVNYRTKLKFSVEALQGAKNARESLMSKIKGLGSVKGNVLDEYIKKFKDALENNLNMSDALALVNELLKSEEKNEDKLSTVLDFDKVLGLDMEKVLEKEDTNIEVSSEIQSIIELRKTARESKDFAESDRLRDKLLDMGYRVLDTSDGQIIERI